MFRVKGWFFKYISLLSIVCFLFLSSGCVDKDVSNDVKVNILNEDKPLKIRFISSWGGFDTKAKALESILNDFMKKNPDIKVINESMAGSDFLFKIKKDFASGNDPDVFCLWPGSDIKSLIKAGKVADLTDILESDNQWKKSFNSFNWSSIMINERIYGLPVEVIFEVLFCNMDLFEKYNIKRPANFSELKEAAIKFHEAGVIPIAFNAEPEGSYLYQNIIAGIGDVEEIETPIANHKVGQCYINAMKYVKELFELGAFPDNALTLSNNERDNLFIEKKAAMIVQGSWFIGNFDGQDKTVEIVPFPRVEPDNKYPAVVKGLGAGVYYMSEKTLQNKTQKDASLKFMKYMTDAETILNFVKATGMISNVNIERYKVGYNSLAEKGILMVNYSIKNSSPPDHFVNRTVWEEVVVKQFPYYLEGKITANALWTNALKKHYDIYGNEYK